METMWIEIGEFTLRAPVTAGTNLALAVQCFLYFRRLRAEPGARSTLPPFYLVTLAYGMLRVPFVLFAIAGFAGTISRYGVLALLTAALAGS
jgi:hypothetical protein